MDRGCALTLFKQRIEPLLFKHTDLGCWIFVGAHHSFGYGQITVNKKPLRTHRITFIAFVGEIPEGMCVCHKCDNPPCCNPDHLFLGTQSDNIRDLIRKKGANYKAKLTREQALEIRRRLNEGEKVVHLSEEFNVSHSTISAIKNNLHWIPHHLNCPT